MEQQIESVLAQEDVNVKLFVRDDGSTDGTVDILKKYEQQGKLQLTVGENIGFKESFSWLIKNAPESEYYACCDQDDFWLPKKLINGVKMMEADDFSVPKLYFSTVIVSDKNLKEITRDSHKHYAKIAKNRFAENLLFNMVYGCSTIFNNALKQEYAKINVDNILSHDYTLSTLACGLGKVYFDDENPQTLYRQHGHNTVGYYSGNLRNFFKSIGSFFTRETKSVRYKEALIFKSLCYSRLSEENQKFIDLMVSYKSDKKSKKKLKKYIKNNISSKFVRNYTLNLLRLNRL